VWSAYLGTTKAKSMGHTFVCICHSVKSVTMSLSSSVMLQYLCCLTVIPLTFKWYSSNLLCSEVVDCLSRDVAVVMIGEERLRDVYNHLVTLLGGEGIHSKVGGASRVWQVIFRVAIITSVMLYSVLGSQLQDDAKFLDIPRHLNVVCYST